ncbi:uncharacterized protein N0V89_012559 [Didymosphaeria variabile]|uniref:Protein kinase domain-containing protein n=1 Tax=Didymosphaeria variabile TaxID=1932322 RepID=A0A9W8XAW0_9PLEO|nr:uncharacterized protein N0V89_012559 [Didymosphaeria variabile]KAJ4344815.1 hypothetical protein N0V89_012559 [Didymosphaeria variabile]
MQSSIRAQAEVQAQRKKQLANSYKQLLDEFNAPDLKNVGNYTLGRLIGKGSFGKVYLASHKLTNGSKVVLKSAKKDDANLAREIHHHRQFIHPHIARLYEVIVTESLVWLVLEYCPGDELYNYLLAHGALEPAKVQKIFTQLVGAVSYVHNKSCVHRDLKLENILLDKYENVKLVDFGFTREYEGKSNYLQTWCGTVCYSAPEMLKGEKYAGEKVDVWSLGIILYALLVGELPFDDDNEMVTKTKILKEEPKYPESFPQQAKELCQSLLSKRPILRPTLADILQNPWLAEHAPRQQEILKLTQPEPFSTELEKEVLHRMRAAGVDMDTIIENVLAQRCDALAGWWALLLEKEERKARRRERKRKEREAEAKSLRRLSAASSRLDKLAPTIKETDEEGHHSGLLGDPPKSRGRARNRSSLHGVPSDLPKLLESGTSPEPDADLPPPPVPKDHIRTSDSSSRPPPPPKEMMRRRSQASMLQVVSTNPDLLSPNGFVPKRRRKYQPPFFNHLTSSLRNWIKETSKRARSPGGSKASSAKSPPSPTPPPPPRIKTPPRQRKPQLERTRPPRRRHALNPRRRPAPRIFVRETTVCVPCATHPTLLLPPFLRRSPRPQIHLLIHLLHPLHAAPPPHALQSKLHLLCKHNLARAQRLRPRPPQVVQVAARKRQGSPCYADTHVVPNNIRVGLAVRGGLSEGGAAFGQQPPGSPGLVFAKRKRSVFKGPGLALNFGQGQGLGLQGSSASASGAAGARREQQQQSRAQSTQGRRSTEIMGIAEEEEDEEEIEEVEEFSPVIGGVEEVFSEEEETRGERRVLVLLEEREESGGPLAGEAGKEDAPGTAGAKAPLTPEKDTKEA